MLEGFLKDLGEWSSLRDEYRSLRGAFELALIQKGTPIESNPGKLRYSLDGDENKIGYVIVLTTSSKDLTAGSHEDKLRVIHSRTISVTLRSKVTDSRDPVLSDEEELFPADFLHPNQVRDLIPQIRSLASFINNTLQAPEPHLPQEAS